MAAIQPSMRKGEAGLSCCESQEAKKQHDGIDDEGEEAEGENGQRERKQANHGADQGVDQPEEQGHDDQPGPLVASHGETGDKTDGEPERDGGHQPPQEKAHGPSSFFTIASTAPANTIVGHHPSQQQRPLTPSVPTSISMR